MASYINLYSFFIYLYAALCYNEGLVILSCTCLSLLVGSQGIIVGLVTKKWGGRLRNHGWVPAGIRDFAVLILDWLWITPNFLFPQAWRSQGLRLNFPWLYYVEVPGMHSTHLTWYNK